MSTRVRRIQPVEAAAIGLPEMPAAFKQEVHEVETDAPPASVSSHREPWLEKRMVLW
jgi:hypothetical protein